MTGDVQDERICVAVRIRPLLRRPGEGFECAVNALPGEAAIDIDTEHHSVRASFDLVFAPSARQIEVYAALKGMCVDSAIEGYNCTLLAYGQTGSGVRYSFPVCSFLTHNFFSFSTVENVHGFWSRK